jgi:putative phosphoribosyl transferase
MQKYQNRQEAGQILAQALQRYTNRDDVIVLALPRGGVPVAFEIANALHVPLDVLIVRKIGAPHHTELAMGAIAMGGARVFNQDIIDELNISTAAIQQIISKEQQEIERRNKVYRHNKPFPDLKGKTIILVDDGIATGATMQAAIKTLRQWQPAKIIVAVPVADAGICTAIANDIQVDDFICPLQPEQLFAVGNWYEDFAQTEDEEVTAILGK